MEKYYYVQVAIPLNLQVDIDAIAMSSLGCTGVEDFSIDEPLVDEILGEKSYSGGDIPEQEILNVEKVVQTDTSLKKYYFQSQQECVAFQKFLEKNEITISHIIEKEVKDWNEEWKKNFSTIKVSDDLHIVPAWEKSEDAKAGELYIYPGMGFGTGSHETTYLCLKFLDNIKQKHINNCIDFGCGSGILGLAVHLERKISDIVLFDIDPQALTNTEQNIELNAFGPDNFKAILPEEYKTYVGKKYDLVFANILLQTLISEASDIQSHLKDGSVLILSGLLKGQEQEVLDYYHKTCPNLELREIAGKGDWIAILMEYKA